MDDVRRLRSRPRLLAAGAGCAVTLVAALGTVACSNAVDTDPLDTTRVSDSLGVVARDLDVPWDLAFLPGGDLLVTERPGRLLRLSPNGERLWSVAVPGVEARGEAGLMGLTLHPRFEENGWVYVFLTVADENRIERFRLGDGGELRERTAVLDGIPVANVHDGGRLDFGPDGHLYALTGDARQPGRARDPSFLGGKVLRMTDTGEPAPGNPFDNHVYAVGLRNPQGLAWSDDGTLWLTDHGRTSPSGFDELNRIVPGGDYGWPDVEGSATAEGVRSPVVQSGPDVTWAPSGAAWLEGRIFFTGLRGESLYEAVPEGGGAEVTPHLAKRYGRLRVVRLGPDGMLWILTGNTDGRGDPRPGDDRLLRIDPATLR